MRDRAQTFPELQPGVDWVTEILEKDCFPDIARDVSEYTDANRTRSEVVSI